MKSQQLTLLLDLDNTLLVNSMTTFLPAYLKALSEYMAPYSDPGLFWQTLLKATQAMALNNRPDRTLKETFDAAFYPQLGLQPNLEILTRVDAFYREIFPTLKSLTRPRPEAITMVQDAFERGYTIALATSPLFPLAAVQERLTWAGLPPTRFHFRLIPSFETFHFSKPNPAYYAEFLTRLGWPNGPVIMVGNDLHDDIEPAQKLGIATYWVTDQAAHAPDSGGFHASGEGSLAEFLPWLDKGSEEALQPNYSPPAASQAILRATPAGLATILQGITSPVWSRSPASGEWSLTEIICHLRDVDQEINIPRIKKIIDENNPFIPAMNPDPWAEERAYRQQDGLQAFRDFTQNRNGLLELLESISPDGWQRPARHTIFGPTTLAEIVGIFAAHDRLHIQQIRKTIHSAIAAADLPNRLSNL